MSDAISNSPLQSPAHVDLLDKRASADDAEDEGPLERPQNDALFHGVILVLCSAIILLAATMSVREGRQVLMPVFNAPLPELCHMKRWTGVNCPGCGMTRAFISLGHGRLADAAAYNPGAFLLFPVILLQIPYRGLQLWRHRRGLPELRFQFGGQWTIGILALVMIGQWILRLCGIGF
jgi:hypothetical protein